jgi:hypothetical protein
MEGMGEDAMGMGEVPAEPDMEAASAAAMAIDTKYEKDTRKSEL